MSSKLLTMNSIAEVGVEPTRPYGQGILSPQRLPFRHSARYVALRMSYPRRITKQVNIFCGILQVVSQLLVTAGPSEKPDKTAPCLSLAGVEVALMINVNGVM